MRRFVMAVLTFSVALSSVGLAGCSSIAAHSPGVAASSTSHMSPETTHIDQPSGLQAVTYRGVTIDVPSSWPVIDGAHAPFCVNPFQKKPTVFVGQLIVAARCPYVPDGGEPKAGGVWLTQEDVKPPGAARVITSRGVALLRESGQAGVTSVSWIAGVSIQLSFGSDPTVESAIQDSVRLTPSVADSSVQGYCPRDGAPPMPTPERLTKTMVLAIAGVTLRPPRATDVASIIGPEILRRSGRPQPWETERLWLARYSAATPATINEDGSTTPLAWDRLALVVYVQPVRTPLGDCSLHSIMSYDARTGESIASAGYTSGQ